MSESMIKAEMTNFLQLNNKIDSALETQDEISVSDVYGQRYIGRCLKRGKTINIYGTPGNDLGIYMDGGSINVYGNGQDAAGNTMSGGKMVIYGSTGDALGYAMMDGEIYVKGSAGFRCGIHMKEYESRRPVIVIGGKCGSFLGEYLAGGKIILLGIGIDDMEKVGTYCAAGMHGGTIYIRGGIDYSHLSKEVAVSECTSEDMSEIKPYIENYCSFFGADSGVLLNSEFIKIKPASARPYGNIYVQNLY